MIACFRQCNGKLGLIWLGTGLGLRTSCSIVVRGARCPRCVMCGLSFRNASLPKHSTYVRTSFSPGWRLLMLGPNAGRQVPSRRIIKGVKGLNL